MTEPVQPPAPLTSKVRGAVRRYVDAKKTPLKVLAVGAIGMTAVLLTEPYFRTSPTSSAAAPPPSPTGVVRYEVEGTATWASVTLRTPTGTTQISPDVPMRQKTGEKGLTMRFPAGAYLAISAQNKEATGTIICRITVDGRVVSENASSGAYAIASCNGQA